MTAPFAKPASPRFPPDLVAVAENVVWFKAPEEALADLHDFLAHAMTYGTLDDVLVMRRHFQAQDLRAALDNAPPGVFDIRSWTYWHIALGRDRVPPLPQRQIPGVPPASQSNSRWS